MADLDDDPPATLGWWAISGEQLLAMLHRVRAGEDPDLVYAEEFVNGHHDEADQ